MQSCSWSCISHRSSWSDGFDYSSWLLALTPYPLIFLIGRLSHYHWAEREYAILGYDLAPTIDVPMIDGEDLRYVFGTLSVSVGSSWSNGCRSVARLNWYKSSWVAIEWLALMWFGSMAMILLSAYVTNTFGTKLQWQYRCNFSVTTFLSSQLRW